jgi:hypothetical protein
MNVKELQKKLEKTEQELLRTKQMLDALLNSTHVVMSIVMQYRCKTCNLIHFPPPLTECQQIL